MSYTKYIPINVIFDKGQYVEEKNSKQLFICTHFFVVVVAVAVVVVVVVVVVDAAAVVVVVVF